MDIKNKGIMRSKAWLCKELKILLSEGTEGDLTYDGKLISFTSVDKAVNINIEIQDMKNADLNNIMGQNQFVINKNDGSSYVFALIQPVGNAEALKRTFFWHKAYANYFMFSKLHESHVSAKKWREVLVQSLPPEKVKYRKEVRAGFLVFGTFVGIAVMALVLFVIVAFIIN